GPRRDEHLRPRLLGLPPGPLLVAARLLGGVPPQLVLDPGPLRLDAGRLPVRRGLLGPAAVRPRPAVRPGPLPAGRGGRPLHLRASLGGPAALPDQRDFRRPGPEPLLLRRLLRGALRETRLRLVGGLPDDAVQLRPAVRLLPPHLPRRGVGAIAARPV